MKLFLLTYFLTVAGFGMTLFQDNNLKESILRGKEIYADFCITCHQANGEGIEETYPPLAKSDYLMNKRMASIRGVKYGQRGELTVNGVTYNNTMAPMGLENQEIADVMNYIYNSWGNSSDKMVSAEEVEAIGPR